MFFQAWRKRAQPGCSSAEASNDCMPETSETICHNNTEKCHTIIKGGRSACAAAFCRADAVTVAPLTWAMDSWVCMGMWGWDPFSTAAPTRSRRSTSGSSSIVSRPTPSTMNHACCDVTKVKLSAAYTAHKVKAWEWIRRQGGWGGKRAKAQVGRGRGGASAAA